MVPLSDLWDKINKADDLKVSAPYAATLMLTEEYEKANGITQSSSPLELVTMKSAELVEPNSQLYSYIERIIDLKVTEVVQNCSVFDILNQPREIVELLLRKCRVEAERRARLAEHAENKAKINKHRAGRLK